MEDLPELRRKGNFESKGESSLRRLFVFSLSLLLVLPLVPILLSTWYIYQDEVERIETHLQETNHQVALLAHHSFNALINKIAFRLSENDLNSAELKDISIHYWIDVAQNGDILSSNIPSHVPGNPILVKPNWRKLDGSHDLQFEVSDVVTLDFFAKPTVLIRIPIAKGFRIAVVDLHHFHTWLTSTFDSFLNRHVYAIDSTGHPLFYSDMKLIDETEIFKVNPPIKFFLNGKSGRIRYISTISRNERIGYVLRMTEAGWGLIASADLGNRILALRERLFWIVVAFLISGLVALGIFVNINRKVMNPLLSIARQVHREDEGEYKSVSLPKNAENIAEFRLLVNELNEYVQDIQRAKQEGILAEKMATMGELTTGLAHELGTPLNVIRGNAQYLIKKQATNKKNRPMLEKIIYQTDRISDLIRNLLDVARIDLMQKEPVFLPKVVKNALKTIKDIYPKISVHVDVEDNLSTILGFTRRLEHAFLNVLDNACQAMDGSGELWISVKTATEDGKNALQVSIEDFGSGIAPEDLPRIFQPFFSTKGSGKGTGLGLALVDRVIKEHGGCIKVNSIPGKGTLFLISFPIAFFKKES